MPDSNTATPSPDSNPEPVANNNPTSNANANATPSPAPKPEDKAKESPQFVLPPGLNKAVERELSRAFDLATMAQKADYAPKLVLRGIDEPFLTTLVDDIMAAGRKALNASTCNNVRKDATRTGAGKEETLLGSLRELQAAARVKHLPDHPDMLDNYFVGQRLDANRDLLDRFAQGIINKSNEERPPGVNTEVIQRVSGEHQALTRDDTPDTEDSKGQQFLAERDAMVKSIIDRRKKIQYAADAEWKPRKPQTVQARKDFQLPLNRPYSY